VVYIQTVAFRPVRRIQQLFRQGNRELPPADLFHLEKLTTELFSSHAQLSQLMRQTMAEASSKYLYDLYMGNIGSHREMKEKWRSYFGDWTEAPLTPVIVSIDRHEAWAE